MKIWRNQIYGNGFWEWRYIVRVVCTSDGGGGVGLAQTWNCKDDHVSVLRRVRRQSRAAATHYKWSLFVLASSVGACVFIYMYVRVTDACCLVRGAEYRLECIYFVFFFSVNTGS